jgi:hypothetical protein
MFAKVWEVTVSFVILSVCLTVHLSIQPHGTTWLPLDEFLQGFMYDYFSKICQENSSLVNI